MILSQHAAEGGTEVKKESPAAARSLIVQLGRYGDILNILPVAREIASQEGGKVAMLVHKDYFDLMDGVSYVSPLQWDGDQMRPHEAAEQFKTRFERVIISQAADNGHPRERITEAFNMEQWRYAGFLGRWSDPHLVTVLDRRSWEREGRLLESYRLRNRPFVLLNTKSISSPFSFGDQLFHDLQMRWGSDAIIADMQRIRAEKFHDLLGLLDHAIALVTVDTATLHLAAASRVPVIALISDTDGNLWHGTKPRCQVVTSMRYREYEARKLDIHVALQRLIGEWKGRQRGRLELPEVTLIGVDNFTPARSMFSLWFSQQTVTFHEALLICQPNPQLNSPDSKGVQVVPMIQGRERVDRERFFITDLHKHFSTSHCLHVEWDARVANPAAWDPAWLQYDYIGAPWRYPFPQPPFPPCGPENCVGNLGFALLSKRFCEAVAQIGRPTDEEARISDAYMCRTLRPKLEEMGIRFAPEAVAARFSCEDRYYFGQFGWHGKGTAAINGFKLL